MCDFVHWYDERGPIWYRGHPIWRDDDAERMCRIQSRTPHTLSFTESVFGACEAPDVVDHVVSRVAREERRECVLGGACCDLYGIWDDKSRHLLLERDNVINGNNELECTQRQ